MDQSFNAFTKTINKHVLGSTDRFNELKQRLAICEYAKDKATAAALGYLIAMEEKEEEESFNIHSAIEATIEQARNGLLSIEEATSITMGLVYNWARKAMKEEEMHDAIDLIDEIFDIYLRPGDKAKS